MLGNIDDMTEKLKILSDICEGLNYLHNEMGIIHRDIKPSNILIKDGVMKIADMGKSKYLKKGEKLKTFDGSTLYMSPEMVNDLEYNISADIWNLGIVFIEVLLNFKFPSSGILCLRPEFPSEYLAKITNDKLRDLISRMLEKDPENRANIQ